MRGDALRLLIGIVVGSGDERGVDGTDAGAGNDVERNMATESLGQVGAQILNNAGFVCTARTTARQDETNLGARTRRRIHQSIVAN